MIASEAQSYSKRFYQLYQTKVRETAGSFKPSEGDATNDQDTCKVFNEYLCSPIWLHHRYRSLFSYQHE